MMTKKRENKMQTIDTNVKFHLDYINMKQILQSEHRDVYLKTILLMEIERNQSLVPELFKHRDYSIFSNPFDAEEVEDYMIENYAIEKIVSQYVEWLILNGEADLEDEDNEPI